jgi:hypothetical protein
VLCVWKKLIRRAEPREFCGRDLDARHDNTGPDNWHCAGLACRALGFVGTCGGGNDLGEPPRRPCFVATLLMTTGVSIITP